MKSFDLDKINSLLENLKGIRVKEATFLRKRLEKEKKRLSKDKTVEKPKPTVSNNRRSSFMKGVWNYVKLVYDQYPELRKNYTVKDVFSMFFARRRGEDVEINDVIWQNPST